MLTTWVSACGGRWAARRRSCGWTGKVGKAHSSCCLLATPLDWVKFGLLLLGRGEVNGQRIVAADFIDRMVTPAPNFAWYGYQIWLDTRVNSIPERHY